LFIPHKYPFKENNIHGTKREVFYPPAVGDFSWLKYEKPFIADTAINSLNIISKISKKSIYFMKKIEINLTIFLTKKQADFSTCFECEKLI